MYPSDDAAPVARGDDVLLHAHQDSGLGPRLLALNYVEVHLVAIEICVVGGAISEVESERPSLHHTYLVDQHGHPVQ